MTATTQARRMVERFGGISKMARTIGYPRSTVQRWYEDADVIPAVHNDAILKGAKALGISLTVEDFATVPADHPDLHRDEVRP